MKIIFADPIKLSLKDKKKFELAGVSEFYNDIPHSELEIIELLDSADVVLTNSLKLDRKIYSQLKRLKFVIKTGVETFGVQPLIAAKYGIKVLNCPKWNTNAVAEHAIGLILGLYRQLFAAQKSLQSGIWLQLDYTGSEISRKNVLLVGYGNVGKRLYEILNVFGATVDYANSKTTKDELCKKVENADITILCCALKESTIGLFDTQVLGMMKSSAILINVSRGPVVDQTALLNLLKTNKIAGAGLDVFVDEPHQGEGISSEILELVNLPNTICTPHIAYSTTDARDNRVIELLNNIEAIRTSRLVNCVN
jgi:phosphoglycerate dehydrogenase-like enzyme